MKKIVITIVAINLLLVVTTGSLVLLVKTHPIQPGQPLYSLQDLAEQAPLRTSTDAAQKAEYALDLAGRRLADLARSEEDEAIEASISAFDRALEEAIICIKQAPDHAQIALMPRGQALLSRAETVFTAMEPNDGLVALSKLVEKIARLQTAEVKENNPGGAPSHKDGQSRIPGEIVSFLGVDVDHNDFPLNGGHEEIACKTCHPDGLYAGTPTECSHCHPQPVDEYLAVRGDVPFSYPIYHYPDYRYSTRIYPEHFPGECSDCHGIVDWIPTQFDHETVVECLSCHENDLPKVAALPDSFMIDIAYRPDLTYALGSDDEHYPGDCQICHTDTKAWETYAYDHDGVTECESCHQVDNPQEHYPGQCLNCHEDYEDWKAAIVNHSELTDCLSCHPNDSPGDHYSGSCSRCHNSEAWAQATFDHSGYSDCRSCHDRPSKHFKGDCANCHTNTDWSTASFSHKGLGNCKSCHSDPGDHYSGECTLCHSSRSWNTDLFSHQGFIDCQGCHSGSTPVNHFTDDCSTCHKSDDWGISAFDHSSVGNDCLSCHSTPGGHYYGPCTDCHSTSKWGAVDFDHTHYKDCLSCHQPPSGHYDGQCSNCHVVSNWSEVNIDHSDLDDCLTCHTKDGHWPGQCSNCHNTTDWGDYTFDHTGYVNCRSCHTRPASHPRGQCSNCHSTDGWTIPTTTATEIVEEQSKEKPAFGARSARTFEPIQNLTLVPLPTGEATIVPPGIEPIKRTIPVPPTPDPSTQEAATPTPAPPPVPTDPPIVDGE